MNNHSQFTFQDPPNKPCPSHINQSHTDSDRESLAHATRVLSVAATALSEISSLYQSNDNARTALIQAATLVISANTSGNKLVICGMGKSGLVGNKIVRTMKSFGNASSFLHPSEALRGDLGDIKPESLMSSPPPPMDTSFTDSSYP
jgi:hypothetical protein